VVNAAKITEMLGPAKFRDTTTDRHNEVGATTGLAWTEVGGQILTTECILMEGKGKLTVTGKLGDVMQESAAGGLQLHPFARAHAGPDARLLSQPGTFTCIFPKGPFRKTVLRPGITIATTICKRVDENTRARRSGHDRGNSRLRGKVLPIGGLKEKLLAAHRHGINEVIIPKDNQKDLPDIPEYIRNLMKLHFVDHMDEVLRIALRTRVGGPPADAGPESNSPCSRRSTELH